MKKKCGGKKCGGKKKGEKKCAELFEKCFFFFYELLTENVSQPLPREFETTRKKYVADFTIS